MFLHLLDETKPFIRFIFSFTGSLLSPDDDETGKQILFGENPIRQEVLALIDHFKFCLVNKLSPPHHAAFIALTDDGNNEIHENNVADYQN
jgi:hypothetical protein